MAAAPRQPPKGIIRGSNQQPATQAEAAPPPAACGAPGQVPQSGAAPVVPGIDLADSSSQAALASFALCALCCLAVVVSATSFYVSRAAAGGKDEIGTTTTAHITVAVTTAATVEESPQARVVQVRTWRASGAATPVVTEECLSTDAGVASGSDYNPGLETPPSRAASSTSS
ncbi:hypothetical protein V5799_009505 [Amblyomma americanum]|uniref:Uncharacterized protein n=1 Tax=Amblyomma americanum TaxID=6943 RepID=A0AAQ4FA77_AMBAM